MAVGSYNTTYTPSSSSSWVATDRVFGVGNGSASGALSDAMVILKNGNVGIGTSTPTQATLVVNGSEANTTFNYGYLNSGGSTGTFTSGTPALSIYASARIAATEFDAYSDARIKDVIGRTDNSADLNMLSQIKITDYKFIDTVAKGTGLNKKVIAQELEQVYPRAVKKITDVVPNIYKLAEIKNGYVSIENNLNAGDVVKLIFAVHDELDTVLKADGKGFSVNTREVGKVFVYGQQVNDFRTVDYEALSTLNISATQELLKMINDLQQENTEVKDKLASVTSDVESIKQALQLNAKAQK
jgi:hypothetical protein